MMGIKIPFLFTIFFLIASSIFTEESNPYKIFEEYKKLKAKEKEITKEIDTIILRHKEVSAEIENLKFVKEKEEEILRRYTK